MLKTKNKFKLKNKNLKHLHQQATISNLKTPRAVIRPNSSAHAQTMINICENRVHKIRRIRNSYVCAIFATGMMGIGMRAGVLSVL